MAPSQKLTYLVEKFNELGYKWDNVLSVPQNLIDLHPDGEPIS